MNLDQFQRLLKQTVILPLGALLLLAVVLAGQLKGTIEALAWVEHSDKTIADTETLLRLIVDQETGLRGYQITADPRLLEPFNQAQQPIDSLLKSLPLSVAYNQSQVNRFRQINLVYQGWVGGFAGPVIALESASGHSTDDELNLGGEAQMLRIRSGLADVLQVEAEQRAKRSHGVRQRVRQTILFICLVALSIGIAIGLHTRNSLRAVARAYQRSLDEMRRQADELFHANEKLNTTLNSIGDGVISCDAGGCVERMNPVAQELCGWSQDEAAGIPLTQVFHTVTEGTREPAENPADKVKRLNQVTGIVNQTILIRRDGTEMHIDDNGAPIRDKDGTLTGIVLVFRDVTQERKTQEALFANQKLAMAGRLSATIAHEIHNPLDAVTNLIYLLQQNPPHEEAAQYLSLAQQELMRVTQISRTMLSLYRESKAPVPVELRDLLEGTLLLMEPRLRMDEVEVIQVMPEPVMVEGFPAELRQVFNNLLSNAAEAAGHDGQVRVTLLPEHGGIREEHPQPGATIAICDNGPGIPSDVLSQLFQPFFTTKGEQGTGLGLWVSRGIVQKHGGSITVETHTEGDVHGSTVRVFLPATIDANGRHTGLR